MARPTGRPVRSELLEAARDLIQSVGVSGFSYGDLGERIGIKAPSIHHHFRHKGELVAAVAAVYRKEFAEKVAAIEGGTAVDRLAAYSDLFVETAANDRLCLCGALTAEWANAGDASKREVEAFFDEQLDWLRAQTSQAAADGELRADIDAEVAARTILATLEGAILLSRVDSATDPVTTTSRFIISLLTPA